MRSAFAGALLCVVASRTTADADMFFHEHSFTSGIATHFVDERTTRSYVPFVGIRSALGVSLPVESVEVRLGPVADLYDQSDHDVGNTGTNKNLGYIVGFAARADTQIERCWWLGGRFALGWGESRADQNGLTGAVFSLGLHARNYSFTFGIDAVRASSSRTSTSVIAGAGVTGRPARIATLAAMIVGGVAGLGFLCCVPKGP